MSSGTKPRQDGRPCSIPRKEDEPATSLARDSGRGGASRARERFQQTRDAETRLRYQMILLGADGWTAPQIAPLVHRSRTTVARVLRRYQAEGPEGVPHHRRPRRPSPAPPTWAAELRRVIDLDPHAIGTHSATWTTGLLGARPQSRGAGELAHKRLRVEALYAAASSSLPPPVLDLLPDALCADLVADGLARRVVLLPQADVYLQDEVEVALHPTLTRVWCPRGRRGQ